MLIIEKHPQPVQAAILLFKQFKAMVCNTTVSNTLQNHPDYPNILSISDALKQWNIENIVLKSSTEKLKEIPVPFITLLNNNERLFATVTKISALKISYYTHLNKKIVTQEIDSFIALWNPIVLLAEVKEPILEKDFKINRRKEVLSNYKKVFILSAILVFIFGSLFNKLQIGAIPFSTFLNSFIIVVFKIWGVIVSLLLLWYDIDKNNALLNQICRAGSKTNCHAILSSKNATICGVSWSEIGFFYFSAGLLLVIRSSHLSAVLYLLAYINLLAIPYTFFSIYYQWKIAKQWCVLCLAIQALLMAELITNIFFKQLYVFNSVQLSVAFVNLLTLICFVLPIMGWYIIKPYLLATQDAKETKRTLNRLKYDTRIFNALLEKQKQVSVNSANIGIFLGNPNAKHTIIKVCNPYCGPCAKAHPELEALLESNTNIKMQVIFTATTDENNMAQKPVKHLLAIAAQNNPVLTHKALKDWYLANKKDYDAFAAKYPLEENINNQNEKVDNMSRWCKAVKIDFTPTYFVNGYQLPDVYQVTDLKYLFA